MVACLSLCSAGSMLLARSDPVRASPTRFKQTRPRSRAKGKVGGHGNNVDDGSAESIILCFLVLGGFEGTTCNTYPGKNLTDTKGSPQSRSRDIGLFKCSQNTRILELLKSAMKLVDLDHKVDYR